MKAALSLLAALFVSSGLACQAVASGYSDLVMSHSPVAYWRLGEASGSVAVDETGSHSGTYQNSVTLGQTGSLAGDGDTSSDFGGGSNDRVQVPAFDASGSGLTMMVWFNADSFGDDRFISKASSTSTSDHIWMLGIANSSQLKVRLRTTGSTQNYQPSVTMNSGQWHFAVATYDGTWVRVYLDGVEVGFYSQSGSVATNASMDVGIGNQPSSAGSRGFNGRLDEPAVLDEALTAGEVAALYSAGTSEGAQFYVRSDGSDSNDGTGSSASDAWATIAHAVTQSEVVAGSTVHVMPGTYSGQVAPSIDGSAGSPIQVVGDTDGEVFGLSGDVVINHSSYALEIDSDSYLTFRGLKIQAVGAGSGVRLRSSSQNIVLDRCRIDGAPYFGVDVQGASSLKMTNCIVSDAGLSGIRSADVNAEIELLHCTIADCGDDGILQSGGTVTAQNTILAHVGDDCWDLNGGTWSVTTSLFFDKRGSYSEGFNPNRADELRGNPDFVDRSSDNYRLGAGSAAIGAGTDLAEVTEDLDGIPRTAGSYDIGAHANGLLGWWTLDETSGTVAADSSALANDGDYENGVGLGQPGARDRAADFDGSNDHVAIPHVDAYFAEQGTVALWFRADSVSGTGGLFSKDSSGFDDGGHLNIQRQGDDIVVRLQSSSASYTVSADDTVEAGQWHFVAFQWGAGGMRLLVDGVEADTDPYDGGLGASSGGSGNEEPIAIGATTDASGNQDLSNLRNYFDGLIDDVRFYGYRLSDDELAVLANNNASGLVGWWKLDETVGAVAADSSGYGNHATFTGGTIAGVSGPYPEEGEYAASFDGIDDAVAVPNESHFDITDEITVAAWIRVDQFTRAHQAVVTKGDNAWRLHRQGRTNFIGFHVNTSSGTRRVHTGVDVNDGTWRHVAATYDGSTAHIYLDGELRSSRSGTGVIRTNDRAVQIGANSQRSRRNWGGDLHDVRVYDRALTHGEIADIYGLVGYWKLDETSGVTAYDSSGKENHGMWIGVAQSAEGKVDNAGDFDGSNAVEVPGLVTSGGSATLSAWVNLTNSRSEVVSIGDDYAIRVDDSGQGTRSFLYDGSSWRSAQTGINLASTGWRYVAATYNKTTLEMKTYIDGVEQASTTLSQPLVSGSLGTNTLIGAHGNGSGAFDFVGQIDEVRIYNRVASPEEIRALSGSDGTPGLRITRWIEVANP